METLGQQNVNVHILMLKCTTSNVFDKYYRLMGLQQNRQNGLHYPVCILQTDRMGPELEEYDIDLFSSHI